MTPFRAILLVNPARRLFLRTTGAGLAAFSAGVQAAPGARSTVGLTEGPFFVDERLERSDIRSDPGHGTPQPGLPLDLSITVRTLDTATGATRPFAGVIVDLWQCNASGLYSDTAENGTAGQKFLRGHQRADAEGRVRFRTVYPGRYAGRAPHIHCKVRSSGTGQGAPWTDELTTQFFFDEALSRAVHAMPAYADSRRGRDRTPDTTNANDPVYQGGNDCAAGAASGSSLTLAVARGPRSASASHELLIDAGDRCTGKDPDGPDGPPGPGGPDGPPGPPPPRLRAR